MMFDGERSTAANDGDGSGWRDLRLMGWIEVCIALEHSADSGNGSSHGQTRNHAPPFPLYSVGYQFQ
jgi:hypothetical protein